MDVSENCEKDIYEQITFVGLSSNDMVTFDEKELKIIVTDIFKCVVKIENCTWLSDTN